MSRKNNGGKGEHSHKKNNKAAKPTGQASPNDASDASGKSPKSQKPKQASHSPGQGKPGQGKKAQNRFNKAAGNLKNIKMPSVSVNSKAYAGLAGLAGAGMMASNFVPKLIPLSMVFKGAAYMAMSAADSKKLAERMEAWDNHQRHAETLSRTMKGSSLCNKPIPQLTTRDYVSLSFLQDNDLAQLAVPVQVEVLKIQTLLEVEALQEMGIDVPQKLEAYKRVSGHLHNQAGIDKLKTERAQIWDVMDDVKSGNYDAAQQKQQSPQDKRVKTAVKMGTAQGVHMAAKKAGKYGKYLRGAFAVGEGAKVMKSSALIICARDLQSFDTPDDYVDYLTDKIETMRSGPLPRRPDNSLGRHLPKFKK